VEDTVVIITIDIIQLTTTVDQFVISYPSMASSRFIIRVLHVQIHLLRKKGEVIMDDIISGKRIMVVDDEDDLVLFCRISLEYIVKFQTRLLRLDYT
jgi:hypothetical protein